MTDHFAPGEPGRWLIVGGLGCVVLTTLGLAALHDRTPASRPAPASSAPVDPYDNCIRAANHPTAGFATEMCEPATQGFQHPILTAYPSNFDLTGCFTIPARRDSDPIRYCPSPEATP